MRQYWNFLNLIFPCKFLLKFQPGVVYLLMKGTEEATNFCGAADCACITSSASYGKLFRHSPISLSFSRKFSMSSSRGAQRKKQNTRVVDTREYPATLIIPIPRVYLDVFLSVSVSLPFFLSLSAATFKLRDIHCKLTRLFSRPQI